MMKKLVAIVLALFVLQTPLAPAATSKPCLKSQVNKIVAGSKCQKVGLVYRWVLITQGVAPTPKPTPTPSPSPSSNESTNKKTMTLEEATALKISLDPRELQPCASYLDRIENSQGELLCMYKDNVLVWHQNFNLNFIQPKTTPTPVQKTEPTTLETIYKKINTYYTNKNNFKFTVIKSPLVDSKMVDQIVSKYESAINFYSFDTNKKVTLVYMSETEKEWYVKKSLEIDRYDWTSWWDNGHCFISATSICSYGNSDTSNPIFYMMVGSRSTWNEEHDMITQHEAVHIYQMLTFKNGYPNCWIIEGQANLIGFAMQSKYSTMLSYRNAQMLEIAKYIPKYRDLSKENWINTFKNTEQDRNKCLENRAGYSLGMVAVESLFLNNSPALVDKFIINYSETGDFEKSLKSILNINLDKFYNDFADHIINAINGK